MRANNSSLTKLRVALVDRYPVFLAGLRSVAQLDRDIEIVGEANDERGALQLLRAMSADVTVLDPSIAELGGAEFIGALKNELPGIKILVLTGNEASAYARQLLQAGADGIATKRSDPAEIARAIRIVASGHVHIDPAIARQLLGTNSASATVGLSAREEEVLRLVAQGFGSKEAATRLGLSTKSIQTYRARAIKKLKLRTRAEIVRYGIARGWLT